MKRSGGSLISKIHHVSGRVFSKLLKESGIDEINGPQGKVLFPLWKKEGRSIQELSEETALNTSTLTRMLDRLEAEGRVRREASPADRRKTLIFLTEKDKRMRDRYEEVSARMTEIFYRGFTEEQIDRFEESLERIFDNVMKEERHGK